MHNTEAQQLILTIIEHAQTSKPSEFHLLRNWTDYKHYKSKRSSFKLLIKVLQRVTDRLFKGYCKSIVAGNENFNKLLAYQQVQQTLSFYSQELLTITDMLDEYDAYLAKGNFFLSFFGEQRAEADMIDFRK